ncbi:unnamed protein product [Heligmosomoides polygyrus]|uniref:FLZ-type domain-containing protein n=1 Tax=Heligmosomoides polygyrus TaxID=6339 RepID=A0A183GL18_HELPZ|nr:unnamed protein product [Heligmosomoides polygyrus]
MRKFYRGDFLKVIAPSLQCLLAVHEKMAVLIIDAEKLLIVLGLPMAILGKSVQILLTIARPELLVNVYIMSGFCKSHGLLCSFLRFLVLPPIIGCLFAEKHVIERLLLSNFDFHVICPQPCLLVDLPSPRLRNAEFRLYSLRFPGGQFHNKIDHTIFTCKSCKHCLTDVFAILTFYTESDHCHLRVRFLFSRQGEMTSKFKERSPRTTVSWDLYTSLAGLWEDTVMENIDENTTD